MCWRRFEDTLALAGAADDVEYGVLNGFGESLGWEKKYTLNIIRYDARKDYLLDEVELIIIFHFNYAGYSWGLALAIT